MKTTATIQNHFNQHTVTVQTDDAVREVSIPGKATGFGSAVNGGELLCLALATCFCNDLYREAQKKGIRLTNVSVEASAEFSAEGKAGHTIRYQAKVEGDAPDEVVAELIRHTDRVAEIQNTLRTGVQVSLVQ